MVYIFKSYTTEILFVFFNYVEILLQLLGLGDGFGRFGGSP